MIPYIQLHKSYVLAMELFDADNSTKYQQQRNQISTTIGLAPNVLNIMYNAFFGTKVGEI